MSRWSRAPREPLPPAPGMILPGVPLAPITGSTKVQDRGSDPLADPDRVLAAQQARATQPLPVRIVVPSQPSQVPDIGAIEPPPRSDGASTSAQIAEQADAAPATSERSATALESPPAVDEVHTRVVEAALDEVELPLPDRSPPSVAERVPVTRQANPRPDVTVPTQRSSSDVFAEGPWPDPAGPSWPRTIPPWGAPPRGFAPAESRVGVVMKDGSRVAPSAAQAREMLGLVASLGA